MGKKTTFILIVVISMVLIGGIVYGEESTVENTEIAEKLKEIGVFKGTTGGFHKYKGYSIYGPYSKEKGFNLENIKSIKDIVYGANMWIMYLLDENDNIIGYNKVDNRIIKEYNEIVIRSDAKRISEIPEVKNGVKISIDRDGLLEVKITRDKLSENIKNFKYYKIPKCYLGYLAEYELYYYLNDDNHPDLLTVKPFMSIWKMMNKYT